MLQIYCSAGFDGFTEINFPVLRSSKVYIADLLFLLIYLVHGNQFSCVPQ